MRIFIDFDDTLIDRQRMTDDIYSSFGSISVGELRQLYLDFRVNNAFTVPNFIKFVIDKGLDGAKLESLFVTASHRVFDYVYPDAIEFLTTLSSAGHKSILLTVDADLVNWQWPKIRSSNLEKYFTQVLPTSGTKVAIVKSLNLNEKFYFIDDKQCEIDWMRSAFPSSTCFKHTPGSSLMKYIDEI